MRALKRLAAKGRGGDSELALTTGREREMLRRMGGAGTINPHTGLKEYKLQGDNEEVVYNLNSNVEGGEAMFYNTKTGSVRPIPSAPSADREEQEKKLSTYVYFQDPTSPSGEFKTIKRKSDPPPPPTYAASTVNQTLTPVSTNIQTEPVSTNIQTEPVTVNTPTLRTVPTTDALAPSGGSELSQLMRMYGVSSASANPYGGIAKPTTPGAFTGTAPAGLSGLVTQAQIDAYNASRDAYNVAVGSYNTSVDQYNADLNQYGADQTKYDQYLNEYNARMQQPMSIYNQAQFGYTSPVAPQDNILLSPTYADGGEVSLKDQPVYESLAAQGRGGDTELALTSARDREMLRRMGGAGTLNPYTGLKEYKGGDDDEPDTSPTIDRPNANPQFTMAHPEFASYKNLYRMEHGLAQDAELPEGWSRTSPQDRAILYMKYNSVTPDARNAYYEYLKALGGRRFTDEQKYNTEMRRSDIMQDLIPKADYAYLGQSAPSIMGGQVNTNLPSYGGVTYGGQYVYRGAAKGGYIKKDMDYESLASKGRGGDSELALTTGREREMLRRMGGAGTVNPYTGLREYKAGNTALNYVKSAFEPTPTFDASTANQSLTPVSTNIQTEPVVTETPTLRTVPTTDALAPSGASELSRLVRTYGVSSASANPYGGVDKPTDPGDFTEAAPAGLSGLVTQEQIDAYNALRDAYNTSVADYNASVDQYNADLNQYGLDQAAYDQYIAEYNARMQDPNSIYEQAQFGYTGQIPKYDNILLSPTYADGGEVNFEDAMVPETLEAMDERYSSNRSEIAAARAKAEEEQAKFTEMLEGALSNHENDRLSKAEMLFRLAAAFGAPTKTGNFFENVGLAGEQMAEYAAGRRADDVNKIKLRLEAQKLKQTGAKENLAALIAAGKPLSSAGKIAMDMGLAPGTPEYVAKVDEIAQRQAEYQQALIAGSRSQVAARELAAVRLSPTELKMKNEGEDRVNSLNDALSAIKQAYALNPQTYDGTLGSMAWMKIAENTDPNDPVVKNTRLQQNLLTEQALAKLKATFGGMPTEGERKILLEIQGIGAKSRAERAEIMKRTYSVLKQRRDREKGRLDEIVSGKYRILEEE